MSKKIQLSTAVLICINTMIGGGLFINPKELTLVAGPFGFVGYIVSACILLPLLLSIAELARLHPVSGGLYVYSKEYLSANFGFLSGWSYFLSKSISASLLIHTFISFFQLRIPLLQAVPTCLLDYAGIFLLITLNILGISIGGKAQYLFIVLKSTPIIFVFLCSFLFFDPNLFDFALFNITSVGSLIPIALYACIGFEVICGIGGLLENPAQNIRKALLMGFFMVVAIAILFQASLFGIAGYALAGTKESILAVASFAFPLKPLLGRLINSIVFTSIIGGAFSMIASNCWNLYTIAQNNHLPFKNVLTKLSSTNVPWVCLLIQGSLASFVITITSTQVALQAMTVFALFIVYFLTALAAYNACRKGSSTNLSRWIPLFAAGTCVFVLFLCFQKILMYGLSFSFISIFLLGCLLALFKKYTQGECKLN